MFDEKFWLACAFVALIAFIFRPIRRLITQVLDQRIGFIQKTLNEATQLREEAEALLAHYKQQQLNLEQSINTLLNDAQKEAAQLVEAAQKTLEETVSDRMTQAMQRISAYETLILQDIRHNAVDVALFTVRALLKEHIEQDTDSKQVTRFLNEINRRLN